MFKNVFEYNKLKENLLIMLIKCYKKLKYLYFELISIKMHKYFNYTKLKV
jgi:hypothetical protein